MGIRATKTEFQAGFIQLVLVTVTGTVQQISLAVSLSGTWQGYISLPALKLVKTCDSFRSMMLGVLQFGSGTYPKGLHV